jgi:hypothetical protein
MSTFSRSALPSNPGFFRSTEFMENRMEVASMRQVLLIVSVLLLGLSWAVAQDSSTPTGAASGQNSSGASGQMTVEGCLSGSSGSFTLTDKNGMAYQLTGDTAKLSEHVGHEIKVTGMSGSGAASSTASSASGSGQTLQVSSVKHISKTCKSAGGGMTH